MWLSYTARNSRSSAVPVTIFHGQDQQTSLMLDQQEIYPPDAEFAMLGVFDLVAGRGNTAVSLSNDGPDGKVVADALRLVCEDPALLPGEAADAPEVSDALEDAGSGPCTPGWATVVDSEDGEAAGVTITGSWREGGCSSCPPFYFGSSFLHDGDTNKGLCSVAFTVDLPKTGM